MYRFEIFTIWFDHFDPFFVAKYHFGVFKEIFPNDEQFLAPVDVTMGQGFLVDLRRSQWLCTVEKTKVH